MSVIVTGGTATSTTAVEALKAYLRITHDAEDELLASLLASAKAWAEGYLGTPLEAVERTYAVGVAPRETYLAIPAAPVDATRPIVIRDPEGSLYDSDAFTLNANAGLLTTGGTIAGRQLLTPGTWSVTCTAGMSVRSDYASTLKPLFAHGITLLAADWYANRNPRASSENDGDTSTVLISVFASSGGVPPWVDAIFRPYRRVV